MSKVICDICGTSYPETSNQCPICGCVRSAESSVVEEDGQQSGGYTYVKGGRFSKSNVRKRSQSTTPAEQKDKKPANKKAIGLIIVLVCLILIVALMIVYILSGWLRQQDQTQNPGNTQVDTTPIHCTGLTLSKMEIEMVSTGEIWMLEATPVPANTTDKLSFSSSDENVVIVSKTGKITCVGEGQAIVTVSCGDQIAECKVSCVFETTTEYATNPPEGVRLNRKSITADYEGFTWILYSGTVAEEDIVWTSDDPSVATVDNGLVTAVAEGKTTVHALYNGVTTSCEITCDFSETTEPDENGSQGGSSGNSDENIGDGSYKLYSHFGNEIAYDDYKKAYDVTISIGETVGLILKDGSGTKLTLEWTVAEGDTCTVEENYVTVHSSVSNCMLKAEHNGVTYYCYVRTVN